MLRKILSFSICFLFTVTASIGQNGSFVYNLFNQPSYWNGNVFPPPANGILYMHPSIDTAQTQLDGLFDRYFKYSPQHFYNHALDSIKILESFTPNIPLNNTFNYYYAINPGSGYRQPNPNKYFTFSIDGIVDTSYTALMLKTGSAASADTEICFFLIPGTGNNQTTELIRGQGYHNTNCGIVTTLKKHGDVYVYVKPNEDYRCFRILPSPISKSLTDKYPTDSYMNQYLNSWERQEGINYLLECVAALKELKKKYKKVFLLGVSQGGYASLYGALEAEVDGTLIASGYTINLDTAPWMYGNMPAKFGQLANYFQKDSIKSKIMSQKTDYFFTYAVDDNYAYQQENANHYTQNYFAESPMLPNAGFFYNFYNHSFPPCNIVDSFVNHVKRKPKAFLKDTLNSCMQDSIVMTVEFIGKKPFQYGIFRNNILLSTVTNAGVLDTVTFYQDGDYQIKNIIDSNGTAGIWSDKIKIRKPITPQIQVLSKQFICDSDATKIFYHCNGQRPFYIDVSKKDSLGNIVPLTSIVSMDTLNEITVTNGQYFFDFHDYYNCLFPKDSFTIQETMIGYQLLDQEYICFQNETKFEIALQGKSPFTFSYLTDSVALNSNTSLYNPDLYFGNGEHILLQVSDSNNCVYPVNASYSYHYNVIDWNIDTAYYDCDSNKARIGFHLSGNPPWNIHYRKDNVPQQITTYDSLLSTLFENGSYAFDSLTDSTGCLLNLVDSFQFNFSLLSTTVSNPVYDCDSNKISIEFTLQGNPPFVLHYVQDGLPKQHTLTGYYEKMFFENGNFSYDKIVDSTGCESPIASAYTFNYTPIAAAITQQYYHCDSNKFRVTLQLEGNPPWQIQYHDGANNYTLNTYQPVQDLYLTNENWVIDQVVDSTGCIALLNTPMAVSYEALNAVVSNPVFDCDSNKIRMEFTLQGNPPFELFYTQDGLPKQHTIQSYFEKMFFENGTFTFDQIVDSTGCDTLINQSFTYNYSPVSAAISQQYYHCDTNKYLVTLQLGGNAPWQIQYHNGAGNFILNTYQPLQDIFLTNENWVIDEVIDSTGCIAVMNDSITVSYQALDVAVTNPVFDCDSNKIRMEFTLQGNPPFELFYTQDGLPRQHTITGYFEKMFFVNGTFNFDKIVDSTGCDTLITQSYTFNYNPVSATISQQYYHCDTNKYLVILQLGGNAPWQIQYHNGAGNFILNTYQPLQDIFLTNENWVIDQVIDSTGCIAVMNDSIAVSYQALDVAVTNPVFDCDSNKIRMEFTLQGNPPFELYYTQDGLPKQHTITGYFEKMFFENGGFSFDKIVDSTGCDTLIGQTYTFNYNPVSAAISQQYYHCDSNKYLVTLLLDGNAPWQIQYHNGAGNFTLNTYQPLQDIFLTNENWVIDQVTDSTGCIAVMNVPIVVSYQALDLSVTNPVFDCDSNKIRMEFTLQGNPPFELYFTQDGLPKQHTITGYFEKMFFENGSFSFDKIVDSTNCDTLISQSYTFNYNPVSAAISQQYYHCDTNKYLVTLQLGGNAPWQIQYHNGAGNFILNTYQPLQDIFLTNENWVIDQVIDSTGCIAVMNMPIVVSYQALDVSVTNPVFDCDSNKIRMEFTFQGNPPFELYYSQDGLSKQHTITGYFEKMFFENGSFSFDKIVDSTSCDTLISQAYTFNYNPVSAAISQQYYHCDTNKYLVTLLLGGNAPWQIQYHNGAGNFTLNTYQPLQDIFLTNENWVIDQVIDSTGCIAVMNVPIVVSYQALDVAVTNPVFDCDSNKIRMEFTLQGNPPFELYYTQDGLPKQHTITGYFEKMFFENGSFSFDKIVDSTSCDTLVSQSYIFNYTPISAFISQQYYHCDSDKYRVTLQLGGNAPWQIQYHNGAGTFTLNTYQPVQDLFLTNENWVIDQVVDSTGCIAVMNVPIAVNYQALSTFVSNPVFDCDSDKVRIDITLQGNFPITVHYNQMGNPFVTQTYNNTLSEYFDNGSYVLEKISDSTQCEDLYGLAFANNYTTFTQQKLPVSFDCDSAKLQINYAVTGDGPFTIHYTHVNTGNLLTTTTVTDTFHFLLPNGQYIFTSINDTKCSIPLSDTIAANYQKLVSTITPMVISCDSAKFFIEYNTPSGNKPFGYEYYQDNVFKNITSYQSVYRQYLDNGNYHIDRVIDSTGCIITYNELLTPQYEPFTYLGYDTKYNCDKDSTAITFNALQTNRIFGSYLYNNTINDTVLISPAYTKFFTNGQYLLQYITDSLGCLQDIQENITIQNEPVNYQISTAANCPDKNYIYTFDLHGRSPWMLDYSGLSGNTSVVLTQQNNTLTLEPGAYNIISLTDGNSCTIAIDRHDTLFTFLAEPPVLNYENGRFTVTPTPFFNYWHRNSTFYDSTFANIVLSAGTGNYFVRVYDSAGCMYQSNTVDVGFENAINLFPNPANNEVQLLVDGNFGKSWHYAVYTLDGKVVLDGTVFTAGTLLNIKDLSRGNYNVVIRLDSQGRNFALRLTKQ